MVPQVHSDVFKCFVLDPKNSLLSSLVRCFPPILNFSFHPVEFCSSRRTPTTPVLTVPVRELLWGL